LKIGNIEIGIVEKPYFIADIAANHDGDINRALKLIELAKESGANAAKFQNFKAEKIVSKLGFDNLGSNISHQKSWKKSVYEVYRDASISEKWTEILYNKCKEVDIEYMTSPYDFESVDLVDRFVNAYKVGSGDITWLEIIEYICRKNKPVIIATGASSMEDVSRAMELINKYKNDVILMQCNTNYTASEENFKYINLNVLKQYEKLFSNAVLGLSDHTKGHSTVLGAVALGARVIEKHFTDDNDRIGPDHKFAMNPLSWKKMVDRTNELYYALGDGKKKIEGNEENTAILQRRALYYIKDLKQGQILKREDIFPLRPIKDDGIPPYFIDEIIGKKLTKDVKKDTYIKLEDF
jgi:N-acetylneuraminate synthase